jgi:nitroimidazol reductase NimA-like FMN-containing flavoprotein (pyridoxamine 5'-phosphate oxidase superfamily)
MTSTRLSDLDPQEWTKARELLRRVSVAFLALVDHGRPYVVPLNFAYEPGSSLAPRANHLRGRLFFHTGPGRKSAALETDNRVCVAISADESFVQGATPCKDGFTFRSVLVEGRAALLQDPGERERALRAIVAKHDPDGVSKAFDDAVLARTLVYAVEIEAVSYRELP